MVLLLLLLVLPVLTLAGSALLDSLCAAEARLVDGMTANDAHWAAVDVDAREAPTRGRNNAATRPNNIHEQQKAGMDRSEMMRSGGITGAPARETLGYDVFALIKHLYPLDARGTGARARSDVCCVFHAR